MNFFAQNIIITVLLPLWAIGFILAGMVFKIENRRLITAITLASTAICTLFTVSANLNIPVEQNFNWLNAGSLNLYLGTLFDNNAFIFLTILYVISGFVQMYSYGYVKDNDEYGKYCIYLNFFNFSMAGLLLSPNLIQLYIFWELVGVASYLLIGFFHKEADVSLSAKKVFFMNRIGDFALLAGIIILAYFSISYENSLGSELLNFSNTEALKDHLISLTTAPMYNLIILLLLIGAFVKSAQFPFHTWLIDAMKAPTPVSALIHSATMVCMGVFLIIRTARLLTAELQHIITFVGLFTALTCAFVAIAQTNIKKMLAYSTSSQLGFMFLALGLGSIPVAIFYLSIHSFTKALLFLCAGAISKAYGTLETEQMGGLKKNDFYLSLFWLIGALSLSGLFFGGLASKETLIGFIRESSNQGILFITLMTSFLTTFYIFRNYFLIFEGEEKSTNATREFSMSCALGVIAVFVIFPIIFTKSDSFCAIVILINLFAVLSAFFSFKCNKIPIPNALINVANKELYLPVLYGKIGNLFLAFCKVINLFDKYVIDNFINSTAKIAQNISKLISKLQNGNIQTYVSYSIFTAGVVFVIILYFYFMAVRG